MTDLRKYITKSKSGHYTATVKAPGQEVVWKETKIASLTKANHLADAALSQRQ